MHITTVPQSLAFFRGQIAYMQARGFDVHALSSPGTYLDQFAVRENVSVHAVEMPRRITPLRDVGALVQLWYQLRRIRPQIVHSHTPKGGLLGMIGATLARVPVRIYHIHGLPLMTARGRKRWVLQLSERVACTLAHQVLCVSQSVRDVAVAEGLCPESKIKVLLGGSINGVDTLAQFNPARVDEHTRNQLYVQHNIPRDALVLGFVGRIVRDKGVAELVEAWQRLRDEFPTLHLLMVGPFEPQDPIPAASRVLLESDPRIHLVGEVADPAPWFALMDVLAFPTYREGFGLVAIEAAAMGVPVVATRIPGCVDAIQDGITGTLVAPRDAAALARALRTYLLDPALRHQHGAAGRAFMVRDFRQDLMWEAVYQEYMRLLRERGVPVPTLAMQKVEAPFALDAMHLAQSSSKQE